MGLLHSSAGGGNRQTVLKSDVGRRRLCVAVALSWCLLYIQAAPVSPASAAALVEPSATSLATYGNEPAHFGIVDAFMAPTAAADTGVSWERVSLFWNDVEPDYANQVQPLSTFSDAELSAELQRGMTVVGMIGNPPAWATDFGSVPKGLNYPFDDPRNEWARFVGATARRYAGRINRWILWNEPDIPTDMFGSTWAGSDAQFYALLKTGYLAIKAANPSATVIFPGTTYWADQTRGNPLFLQRILEIAQADPSAPSHGYYMDAVDMHIYSKAFDLYRIPLIYRGVLSKFHLNTPLMISEMNVAPYDDPKAPAQPTSFRSTLDQQAAFIVEGMTYAMAAGVRWMSIFKMADFGTSNGGPYGLVRADHSARPALTAYKLAINYLTGVPSIALQQTPGSTIATFTHENQDVTIAWATGQAPATVHVKVNGTSAFTVDKFGAVQPQAIPLSTFIFQLALPGSTSNSDDGGPRNSRIGGNPVVLVQTGIGGTLRVSPTLLVFPSQGLSVTTPFIAYYDAAGGAATLGPPLDNQALDHGMTIQHFAKASLRYHPEFKGSVYEMESVPAGTPFPQPDKYVPYLPSTGGPNTDTHRYFPATGHTVAFGFLAFFNEHGGLDVFGFPRTDEFQENGTTVQWFQRAKFVFHADVDPAHAVQVTPLGTVLTVGRDFPKEQPFKDTKFMRFFPDTGHGVAFGFLHFYLAHGGASTFGNPISDELPEADASGAIRTVQYFENARFEYHPELAGTPWEVELGLLGDEFLGIRQ